MHWCFVHIRNVCINFFIRYTARELFDVTLRLLVNLTNPELLLFKEELPEDKETRNYYLQIQVANSLCRHYPVLALVLYPLIFVLKRRIMQISSITGTDTTFLSFTES
jgi:hypothetical protein